MSIQHKLKIMTFCCDLRFLWWINEHPAERSDLSSSSDIAYDRSAAQHCTMTAFIILNHARMLTADTSTLEVHVSGDHPLSCFYWSLEITTELNYKCAYGLIKNGRVFSLQLAVYCNNYLFYMGIQILNISFISLFALCCWCARLCRSFTELSTLITWGSNESIYWTALSTAQRSCSDHCRVQRGWKHILGGRMSISQNVVECWKYENFCLLKKVSPKFK